jgi:hypothetical protein
MYNNKIEKENKNNEKENNINNENENNINNVNKYEHIYKVEKDEIDKYNTIYRRHFF